MAKAREVAGGGRAVEVEPERLAGWFERFAARNGGVTRTVLGPDRTTVVAANGTTATVDVGLADATTEYEGAELGPLLEYASRARRIGLLLVRLGGHSIGLAENGRVLVSRTDRRLVHGRSAAGGWSQQRFARRREGQARVTLRAAADDAAEVLLPRLSEVDSVVLGGDRKALDELREDRRLAPVFALAEARILDLGEPRRSLLDEAAARARAVEIVIRDG